MHPARGDIPLPPAIPVQSLNLQPPITQGLWFSDALLLSTNNCPTVSGIEIRFACNTCVRAPIKLYRHHARCHNRYLDINYPFPRPSPFPITSQSSSLIFLIFTPLPHRVSSFTVFTFFFSFLFSKFSTLHAVLIFLIYGR